MWQIIITFFFNFNTLKVHYIVVKVEALFNFVATKIFSNHKYLSILFYILIKCNVNFFYISSHIFNEIINYNKKHYRFLEIKSLYRETNFIEL